VHQPQLSPELADAADILGERHREKLLEFAELLRPFAGAINREFERRLEDLGFDAKQIRALAAITPGAAALMFEEDNAPLNFIEQVEYNGRRLAKLRLSPNAILDALKEYDDLLNEPLKNKVGFHRVRELLHFCVMLTLNNAYYQVRDAETRAFYEQFRIELESRNLDDLLGRFVVSLIQVCRADAGCLYMLDESDQWICKAGVSAVGAGVANQPGLQSELSRPLYLNLASERDARAVLEPSWRQAFASCWSVPLASAGRTEGVMQFAFRKEYEWLPREQELLAAAAERCVMAAQKQRLMEDLRHREEQVRRLAEHMLHVEEVERRRISHELHDEAGQSLLCIRLQMEMLEEKLPREKGEWLTELRQARELTERTILEMRRLISALSPAVLEQLGLAAALRQLVLRFERLNSCRVRLHLPQLQGLSPQTETIAYRLVQECFNNIGKHASASQVNLAVTSSGEQLRICIEDNGRGFPVADAMARRDCFGLAGMRERVTLLNGTFQVESRVHGPKTGTKIFIELPISKTELLNRKAAGTRSRRRGRPQQSADRVRV
jgi:signal transduction histidine kinase